MALPDPHSYADDLEPSTRHLALSVRVDVEGQRLAGTVSLHLDRAAAGRLTLDGRGLLLESAYDGAGRPVPFERSPADEDAIRGERWVFALEGDRLDVRFQTGPGASALQWLLPEQTAGGERPFVFTQCQPTHARSLFPCQDSPRVRFTYTAELDVPSPLRAVMAAAERGATPAGDRTIYRFEMPQPIPAYLFAFAVGDLAARELGPRTRVWAEPSVVEQAASEFAPTPQLIDAAEQLFGPYDWERFDLLVMPPSFPYGGMENPRLTFLTPTLLAGDRSLVNVVAHELAHSWTGNLVTNASMNDFWLNEGFTTYAERRILEATEGEDETTLQVALGRKGLEADLGRFPPGSPLTRLRNELEGIDPDSVYSRIPYEKGYLFVRRLEEAVGRPRFDGFLRAYLERFRFRSITTAEFLVALAELLPEAETRVDLAVWIDAPGLPDDAPHPRSARLEALGLRAQSLTHGPDAVPSREETAAWNASAWQVFLSLAPPLSRPTLAALDARYRLSVASNAEIRIGFLTLAARAGYRAADQAIEASLATLGRMKYLRPLYTGLVESGPEGAALAARCFERYHRRYHPVAQAVLRGLLPAREDARASAS